MTAAPTTTAADLGRSDPTPARSPSGGDSGTAAVRRGSAGDMVLGVLTRAAGAIILLMLLALLALLFKAAWPSITKHGVWGFLVARDWNVAQEVYGAAPMILGTLVTSAIAVGLAVPLALGCALFIVRIAPRWRIAGPAAFLVEFLAAIPSIAYGMWGMFVLAPFLQSAAYPFLKDTLGLAQVPGFKWMFTQTITLPAINRVIERPLPLNGFDVLCGGLVLAIMIIPIITAVSRDVLKAVPRAQIEGTLALGATWWQASWSMLRYSRSGLFGAVMLGLARAAGETMAVTLVIGNSVGVFFSPMESGSTMASLLASQFNEAKPDLQRPALLHVALVLLVMSLLFNVVARALVVGKNARSAAAH